jgi:hypothetical protein
MGTEGGGCNTGVKQPGHETDHTHVEPRLQEWWSYISTPPMRLHETVLSCIIMYKDNFISYSPTSRSLDTDTVVI